MQYPIKTNATDSEEINSDIHTNLNKNEEANHSKNEIEDLLVIQETDGGSGLIYSSEIEQMSSIKHQKTETENDLQEELKIVILKIFHSFCF